MRKTKLIKQIINENQHNIAFIIGNGIHYQYHDCDISWEDLLKSLWEEYNGDYDIDFKHLKGISFTEFYDIIEMNAYNEQRSRWNFSELASVQPKIKFTQKDFSKLFSSDTIQLALKVTYDKTSYIEKLKNYHYDKFRKSYDNLIKTSRKWCEDNFENASNWSDEMCISQMTSVISNNKKIKILKDAVKHNIVNKFPQKNNYNLLECANFIKELNAPILTTNFDTYISDSLQASRRIFMPKDNLYKFNDFYPWNVYFSEKDIDNSLDEFAVWHINGMTDYHRSIKLGLSDYMGCVERSRKMIQGDNSLNEFFSGKNNEFWIGYNTWLHVLFNKNLFIFGLALDENEVFLRWLLIQRAKYSRMYNTQLKGWYINKKIPNGKRFFLEQLGLEVIDIKNYDDLYNAFK